MALFEDVREYWNRQSCGTGVTEAPKYSREYFDEIEEFRYRLEPEIHGFAQFTNHTGKKVLEVGVGAGTDFLQWCRAGTEAHGIDLTDEAISNVRERLIVYGLNAADLRVGNAEDLPYPDGSFDLVYSWGVIHHSPDTEKCLSEISRVARKGASVKVMVYNRHSIQTYVWWVRYALLRGKPWLSLAHVLYHHMESPGTKGYTRSEFAQMAKRSGLTIKHIDTTVSEFYDLLVSRPFPLPVVAYCMATLFGFTRCGWFLRAEMVKR
jgi:ubiquinone/menaquinone biosynthesis C-methylase UbiE